MCAKIVLVFLKIFVHIFLGCVNLSFSCVEGESLLMALKNVALSSGSACTSASLEPSYVLRAIGAEEDLAHSSIRFGIGRFTTEEVCFRLQFIILNILVCILSQHMISWCGCE